MCSFSTVSCVQWTPKGSAPIDLESGYLAGFARFFENSPAHLSSYFIGLAGNHRFQAIGWLNQQATKSAMEQHVAEVQIRLMHTYTERINGVDGFGLPTDEYDLMKATASLKQEATVAYSKAALQTASDREVKARLLAAGDRGDMDDSLAKSSVLFSRAAAMMRPEFQRARAIFFPAYPINLAEWKGNPARLIAFKKEAIVRIKSSKFANLLA